jgi:lysophospholipase L1-like esterase
MTRVSVFLVMTTVFTSTSHGQSTQPLLCDISHIVHKPGEVTTKDNKKVPAGTVELVDGQFGKACKFTLADSASPQFFTAWINHAEDWDQYDGFSFWVKGDGSKSCGGLELIDGDDFGQRFGYCFPIQSKQWVKVTVPWSDVIPELSSPPIDARAGYAPNRLRNIWVGKWFYWREHPACSFTLEKMALEKHIDRDTTDYRPKEPGLPRLLAKLKARQPVTIVTMGDSLTDKQHWANRQKLWAEELVAKLQKAYGGEVTFVNPAIGGTTLSQNAILVPRWLQEAPSPDLVIIWFGGNDWDAGVRGDRYQQYLQMTIDQLRRATKGAAEILVMTTCPGFANWQTRNELCRAAFEAARDRRTGFVDVATAFHKAGSREEALKRQYWAWDNVHLGPGGHDLIAEAVFQAIGSGGAGDLAASANASWMKARIAHGSSRGETCLSSFEPNEDDLVNYGAGQVVKEHASDGAYSLRLTSKQKDYPGFSIEDGRALQLLHENSRLLVDVFNPQDKPVDVQILVRDPQATNYNLRYNGTVTVKPGMSTIDVDYTRLPRYATQKNDKPEILNARQITLFVFFLDQGESTKPLTLFFDNVRVARQAMGRIQVRPAGGSAPPAKSSQIKPGAPPRGVELLSSFEPGGPGLVEGDGTIVAEHATDGRNSLRVQSDGRSYMGLRIAEGRALRKFKNYVLLKIDVFNPQNQPIHCGARIDDAKSHGYGTSLVECGHVDAAHVSAQYAEFCEAWRGYGGAAHRVMRLLKDGGDYRGTGRLQFPEGSFGNGGAMRIAPVGLAYRHATDDVLLKAVEDALVCTQVHPEAVDCAKRLSKLDLPYGAKTA